MHRRFFVDFKIGDEKEVIINDKEILHQLVSVFRAKAGEDIVLLDNSGFKYAGIIKDIGKKEAIVEIIEKIAGGESRAEVAIFQSIIKKDNMELILEKCTEIGIAEFAPILAEHCVKLNLNFERLQKIAKEASEQCGRAKLPEISEITDFKKAVEAAADGKEAVNFIFHAEGFCGKLNCEFLKNFSDTKKFNLFIGPEGGFSDVEIELAKASGFYVLSLGDLILRSETAAIVSSFSIINNG